MFSFANWLRTLCVAGAMLAGGVAHAQWQALGGPAGPGGNAVHGAPTCFSLTTGASSRIDCYVTGGDGGLWRRSSPNGEDWSSPWQSLGGAPLFDMPECVWWLAFGNDRIDCFVVFTDRALWQRTSLDGGANWQPWVRRGGDLHAQPSCAIWRAQQINCYGLFTDSSIRLASQDGANTVNWHDWVSLGAGFDRAPHCRAWHNGANEMIDCFARRIAGGTWVTLSRQAHPVVSPPPLWAPWPTLVGPIDAFNCRGPFSSAKVECYGYASVLMPSSSGRSLVQLSTDPAPLHWTRFGHVTAPSTSVPANQTFMPSCVGMGPETVCFTVARNFDAGFDGELQLFATPLSGGAPRNVGGVLTSSPACVTMPDNVRAQCFARGTDGNLWRVIVSPDIPTATINRPLPPAGTPIGRCRPGIPGCP